MLIKHRMHPRNIYRTPPNFKDLAICYPEFRKYVKQELSGKMTIDFTDPNAVKELNRVLLKKDFGLEVEINETRLIPRVPLCLNYILWIEDLLNGLEQKNDHLGIDIGTGCVCIYSLLAAKRGWKMLATEVDPVNFKSAEKNVNLNNLQDYISVKLVPSPEQLLVGIIDMQTQYDFCMCNPPFFYHNEKPQNRTSRRPQIETVASDVPVEISSKGGEISFIKRLIHESKELKDKIKIFTTLVGKKSDFLILKKEVQGISPTSVGFTEFCQGKTIRWGLAWSFMKLDLKNKVDSSEKKTKKEKPKPPLQYILPWNTSESINKVHQDVKEIFNNLKINYTEETCDSNYMLHFKAYENTWSHQRRKKRLKARIELEENNSLQRETKTENVLGDTSEVDESPKPKKIKLDSAETQKGSDTNKCVQVEGSVVLRTLEKSLSFEMSWISGNKEYLHQIFQYFKNHWDNI